MAHQRRKIDAKQNHKEIQTSSGFWQTAK